MESAIEVVSSGKVLHVRATGKLTKEFYEAFVPAVDQQIEAQGNLRILFEMHDFHGWTAGALWQDLRFDMAHWRDIEKLAIVGETKWEEGMAAFCKPFTSATVKYFDHSAIEEAKAWVEAA